MNKKLLKICGDRIEALYKDGPPAKTAWQRLRGELALAAGTETEKRLLVTAEIAKTCHDHGWPVWETDSGTGSIILYLLGLNLADPIEHGLLFECWPDSTRGFGSQKSFDHTSLWLTTPNRSQESLEKAVQAAGAEDWIYLLRNATPTQQIPFLVDEDLQSQGKAPDWKKVSTSSPTVWEFVDTRFVDRHCIPDVYQLNRAEVHEAKHLWQPTSLVQMASITAIVNKAKWEKIDPISWARKEQTNAELLMPWVHETYGVLIFREQVMQILNKIGGLDLATGWDLITKCWKNQVSGIDHIEKQFLAGAVERGYRRENAREAFHQIQYSAEHNLTLRALHVADAVITFRSLYHKLRNPQTYQLHTPPELAPQPAK